ncbi:Cold acclimation protein WCOR413 family [Prunus dulcis]|uniref:Cold acclimation protein WCOR413 family n=1 Tax=Prunus dulcis TaxID=3755 RepID=A0A4Y1RVS7_PRUDU|nr:Cold acclimation protein WCOR413 family [Prunus dulcis]
MEAEAEAGSSSSRARATFQWGGTIFALGQFGCWVSFLAVAANLIFPRTFPVSRFLLFVVPPTLVANGLRDSIVGCIFCLMLGVLLVVTEIRGIGENGENMPSRSGNVIPDYSWPVVDSEIEKDVRIAGLSASDFQIRNKGD